VKLAEAPVAILAGGRATRLGPLAANLPKALVPVAGRPFLDHQLALLHRRGLRRVVLCLGHLGQQVVEHVGDGSRFGLEVVFSFDGERPLGTGGALRQAAPVLGPLYWVLYGDSYLDFDYDAALKHFLGRREPAMMTVFLNRGRWDESNVVYSDGRVLCYDKRRPSREMTYIDYGACLLRAAAVERVPLGEPYDLADLYRQLAAERLLAGYQVNQRFYEIGSIRGLQEAERHLSTVDSRPPSAPASVPARGRRA